MTQNLYMLKNAQLWQSPDEVIGIFHTETTHQRERQRNLKKKLEILV